MIIVRLEPGLQHLRTKFAKPILGRYQVQTSILPAVLEDFKQTRFYWGCCRLIAKFVGSGSQPFIAGRYRLICWPHIVEVAHDAGRISRILPVDAVRLEYAAQASISLRRLASASPRR